MRVVGGAGGDVMCGAKTEQIIFLIIKLFSSLI